MRDENRSEGTYEASERGGGIGTAITFLLVGLGAGALLGMLYAPKPGKQMRKDLRRRYQDACETFDDWTDQARDIAEEAMERGSDIVDDLRERVGPIARNIRRS
jgi:gas vesicle protein